jgi:Poly(ADP-ribose) polymerase catalytic domain
VRSNVEKEIWQGVIITPHSKECKGHVPNFQKYLIANVWAGDWQISKKLPNWIGKLTKMEEKLKNVIVVAASTSIGGFRVLNTWKVNEMNTTEEQILSFHGSPTPAAEGIVSDGLRSGMEKRNGNLFSEFVGPGIYTTRLFNEAAKYSKIEINGFGF